MPLGRDWLFFIFVNVGFIMQVIIMYYSSEITKIKQDWPQYRCNPMFMPLSDDIKKDFTFCIQNMQTDYMGFLLQPITYITSNLVNMSSNFSGGLQNVREMFSYIRQAIITVIENIFGVFLNLIIEFQKIIVGIKDLMGKIIGVVVTLMYLMEGSILTMNSAWNAPPGQIIRAVGHCFDPNTRIRLRNGTPLYIKDVQLKDSLEDGSIVLATMKIANLGKDTLYQLSHIRVTGSHYVYYNNHFIQVKDHPDAIPIENSCPYYSCLITDTHFIKIGSQTFYDWEDFRL